MIFVNMLHILRTSFLIAFSRLRFGKLAHTFSDKMRIATKDFFACIVWFLIIHCIDSAYNEQ